MEVTDEVVVHKPITEDQQTQLKDKVVEQRGKVDFIKTDTANLALVKGFDHLQSPTDGQIVMAKMLATPIIEDPQGRKDLKPRPAGYAIAFSSRPVVHGQDRSRIFYENGSIILTSPVEQQGKTSYVMADKDGVAFVQAKGESEEEFLSFMRDKFSEVGDQENDCFVNTETPEGAHPKNWGAVSVLRIEGDLAASALKAASEESLKAPFISPKDVEVRGSKKQLGEVSRPQSSIPLSKVNF